MNLTLLRHDFRVNADLTFQYDEREPLVLGGKPAVVWTVGLWHRTSHEKVWEAIPALLDAAGLTGGSLVLIRHNSVNYDASTSTAVALALVQRLAERYDVVAYYDYTTSRYVVYASRDPTFQPGQVIHPGQLALPA